MTKNCSKSLSLLILILLISICISFNPTKYRKIQSPTSIKQNSAIPDLLYNSSITGQTVTIPYQTCLGRMATGVAILIYTDIGPVPDNLVTFKISNGRNFYYKKVMGRSQANYCTASQEMVFPVSTSRLLTVSIDGTFGAGPCFISAYCAGYYMGDEKIKITPETDKISENNLRKEKPSKLKTATNFFKSLFSSYKNKSPASSLSSSISIKKIKPVQPVQLYANNITGQTMPLSYQACFGKQNATSVVLMSFTDFGNCAPTSQVWFDFVNGQNIHYRKAMARAQTGYYSGSQQWVLPVTVTDIVTMQINTAVTGPCRVQVFCVGYYAKQNNTDIYDDQEVEELTAPEIVTSLIMNSQKKPPLKSSNNLNDQLCLIHNAPLTQGSILITYQTCVPKSAKAVTMMIFIQIGQVGGGPVFVTLSNPNDLFVRKIMARDQAFYYSSSENHDFLATDERVMNLVTNGTLANQNSRIAVYCTGYYE